MCVESDSDHCTMVSVVASTPPEAPPVGGASAFGLRRGQSELENRPARQRLLHRQFAAVSLDDGSADRQANPQPAWFGAVESIEDVSEAGWIHARAGILDRDADIRVDEFGADRELSRPIRRR